MGSAPERRLASPVVVSYSQIADDVDPRKFPGGHSHRLFSKPTPWPSSEAFEASFLSFVTKQSLISIEQNEPK